jgi:hypothetical protein
VTDKDVPSELLGSRLGENNSRTAADPCSDGRSGKEGGGGGGGGQTGSGGGGGAGGSSGAMASATASATDFPSSEQSAASL